MDRTEHLLLSQLLMNLNAPCATTAVLSSRDVFSCPITVRRRVFSAAALPSPSGSAPVRSLAPALAGVPLSSSGKSFHCNEQRTARLVTASSLVGCQETQVVTAPFSIKNAHAISARGLPKEAGR